MDDLNDKITGGTLTAAEWNQVPSEIQNVIEGLGITLSSGDVNQLGKAIAGYVANGAFYTDSGAANAYVLSVVGSKQAPTAYTDGMKIRFHAGNNNTGASTVNVASLGVKNIKTPDGGNPSAGDIPTTRITEAWYDSSAGYFVLDTSNASTTERGIVELATNAEVQTGTDTVRAVTPAGLASFGKTLSANGYQKFPGGLLIQWQTVTSHTSGTNVSFPITFPTACLAVFTTDHATSAATVFNQGVSSSPTTTQVLVYLDDAAGAPNFFMLSIGY